MVEVLEPEADEPSQREEQMGVLSRRAQREPQQNEHDDAEAGEYDPLARIQGHSGQEGQGRERKARPSDRQGDHSWKTSSRGPTVRASQTLASMVANR